MSADLARRVANGEFDAETLAWLRNAFTAWLLAGEDIEQALELDRARRIREHNRALIQAGRLIREQCPSLSNWAVAGRLAAAIRHYENRIMPMLAHDPGREMNGIEAAIHAALSTWHRGPRTQRKLFDLLN